MSARPISRSIPPKPTSCSPPGVCTSAGIRSVKSGIAQRAGRQVSPWQCSPVGGDPSPLLVRGAVRLMQHRDAEAQQDFDRFLRRRPKSKADLEEMIAKWKQDRPVFDQSTIDDLCKYRPGHG